MATPEVTMSATPHKGLVMIECSECGPVAVSDQPIATACLIHLVPVHGMTELRQVEAP